MCVRVRVRVRVCVRVVYVQAMNLLQKEQLYLDCCASWNVEKKQLISDDEFEDLKSDLTFEGSQVS